MDTKEFNRKYADILHLPHHVSKTRRQMSLHDRAAQFAPFAALTGYDAVIRETARLTDREIELTEWAKSDLDAQLRLLCQQLGQRPVIRVTYFLPDARKTGGQYITCTGIAAELDSVRQLLILANGTEIPFENITALEGDIFTPKEPTE